MYDIALDKGALILRTLEDVSETAPHKWITKQDFSRNRPIDRSIQPLRASRSNPRSMSQGIQDLSDRRSASALKCNRAELRFAADGVERKSGIVS